MPASARASAPTASAGRKVRIPVASETPTPVDIAIKSSMRLSSIFNWPVDLQRIGRLRGGMTV
jgi:hypothetical protein